MLGDLSGVSKIFVITGRTDMRKSFDGLMAIIRDTYELDPYANAVYLFCGRDSRKLKALHFDKDGFVLLQKRLDGNGRFQWPRNASEARLLTRQEFRWLMEGLSIDQPKQCTRSCWQERSSMQTRYPVRCFMKREKLPLQNPICGST